MVRHRILIVDDDKWLTQRLSYVLHGAGCLVFVAHDAESATRVALRERPDVILLEVELPRYSGLEFHECLQYADRGRDIPVIYVTGNDSPVLRRAANQLGAKGFLKKPIDGQALLAFLRRVLSTRSEATEQVATRCQD